MGGSTVRDSIVSQAWVRVTGEKCFGEKDLQAAQGLLGASSMSLSGTSMLAAYDAGRAAKEVLRQGDLAEQLKKALGQEVTLKFEDCDGRCVRKLWRRGMGLQAGLKPASQVFSEVRRSRYFHAVLGAVSFPNESSFCAARCD